MQRTNQARLAVAVLALGLAGGACSAEKIGEGIAERAIENACEEEGTQCEIDIEGDSVQLQTEDGTMTVDEDGNAVIVGPDGSVVQVEAGADGDLTVTGADGSVVASQDGDTLTIAGDEGDMTVTSGTEIPAEFPAAIALPDGATVSGSTVLGDPSAPGGMVMLNLVVPGALADVAAAAAAGVTAAGYSQISTTESADGHFTVFEGNGQSVSLAVAPDSASGGQMVTYSIAAGS